MNVFTNFSNMISSIISKTPSNLDETAIEQGHVHEFKRLVAPPSERSKTNTRKCNMNTLGIDPLVSCYPHEVLLELRDAFNASLDYPGSIDSTVDTTIVEALRDRLGHTEDLFLKLLDPAKRKLYPLRYFESTKFDPKMRGTEYVQYASRMRQLEIKYPNYVDITYIIQEGKADGDYDIGDDFTARYNRRYTDAFLHESELVAFDDAAMFVLHETYTHLFLVMLLQIFLKLPDIEHISISLIYKRHAQAIYINKTGKGHYMFYNSNDDPRNECDQSIEKDVKALLHASYPRLGIYRNRQHQYIAPLCYVFATTFIESMLKPGKTLKEKFKDAAIEENRDDSMIRGEYEVLNANMPFLRVRNGSYQKVTSTLNSLKHLFDKTAILPPLLTQPRP
jgi:hypothetical protein